MAASRARKATIMLVVLLVGLIGLFVVVDRVAAYAAGQTIADQATQQLAAHDIRTPDKPSVSIGGFPFLTQVASGRYEKITIHTTRLTTQGVTIDRLDVTATGVNAKASALMNGTGTITADEVRGTATMGWDSVTKVMDVSGTGVSGVTISALPDGDIQLRAPVTMLGTSTTVVAVGKLDVNKSQVQVRITKISTEGGDVPPVLRSVLNTLKSAFAVTLKLPDLPYHLVITGVRTTSDGIQVTAVAHDVPLTAGSD